MKSIEWLAGLLEGEGCFTDMKSGTSGNYRTPLIALVMTDFDVIVEAHKVVECLGGRNVKISQRRLKSGKIAYSVYITGFPAIKVMHTVLPFMGERRSQRIRKLFDAWKPVVYKDAVEFKQSILGVA